MTNWNEKILANMDISLSGIRDKDQRFFRIDELRRNITRVSQFAETCHQCLSFKEDIESNLVHLNEAINVPGQCRRDLDRLIARLSRHMIKAHHFYPPYHFNYLFTTYGLLAGLALALPLILFFPYEHMDVLAAGIFITGLLAGRIIGGKRDRKIRNDKKLM